MAFKDPEKVAANQAAYRAAYYAKNKDKFAAYYLENKDKFAAYYLENKDKFAERGVAWRATNKEQTNAWRAANKERIGKRDSARSVSNVKSLAPHYVASLLGLPIGTVPESLINLKRMHILLKRELKKASP